MTKNFYVFLYSLRVSSQLVLAIVISRPHSQKREKNKKEKGANERGGERKEQ